MSLDDIILAMGMFGLVIFMYKRELFIGPKAFWVILIISLIMLALAYLLPQFDTFKHTPVNVFKLPFITLLLYRITRGLFTKAFGREPKDTFWMAHWEKGDWKRYCFQCSIYFNMGNYFWTSIGGYNMR